MVYADEHGELLCFILRAGVPHPCSYVSPMHVCARRATYMSLRLCRVAVALLGNFQRV